MKKIVFALIAGFAAMTAAQAQTMSADQPHFYVGAGAAINDNATTGDTRVGGKVFGGYQIDPNWGVEAGYTQFDKQDVTAGGVNGEVKGNSSYVAGTYTIPFNERFSGYGKLGISNSERKFDGAGTQVKDTDTGVYAGLGVQYKLNQNLALIGEYERYGKDKDFGAKADVVTVGLKYGF
jgi:opacity protein-like surface antigen